MNLFNRKVHLFCISNIMVSFVCTGLVGINGYANTIESTTDEAHEISLTASDTEPVSHNGEGEDNKYAFVTNSVEAVIEQHEMANSQEYDGEENKYAIITNGIEVVLGQQETKVEKKTETTKKKSTSKKTTSVVTKKEVASTYSYSKPSYSSVTGDAIVSFARQFIGLKYVHAGRSLKTGTDCSGFTMLIYREFGVNLPPTVSGQISRGKYVAKKDLQKGDLVFYKAKGASGGASHVGIYIGSGLVIHESRPGVGVKTSTVNMMQYVTARRVINSTAVKIAEQKLAEQNQSNTTTTTNNDNSNNSNSSNNTTTTEQNNNTTLPDTTGNTNVDTTVTTNEGSTDTNNNTNNETTITNDNGGNTSTPTSAPTSTPTPVETPKPETPSTPPETNNDNQESTSTEGSN